MKRLWLLLPIVAVWVLWNIGGVILPHDPFQSWWAVPTVISLGVVWCMSFIVGIERGL